MSLPLCECGCGQPVKVHAATGKVGRFATRACIDRARRQRVARNLPTTLPKCECGCGQPVKIHGNTGKVCRFASLACRKRAKLKQVHRCVTCRKHKPLDKFAAPNSKRCLACERSVSTRPCASCGRPAGLLANGRTPRQYCLRPECQHAMRRATAAISGEKRHARVMNRKQKVCPACAHRKPVSEFGELHDAEGNVVGQSTYCKPCRRAAARERWRSDAEYRAGLLDKMAERYQRDRGYDDGQLASRRAAKRVPKPTVEEYVPPSGPRLSARPVVAFIDSRVQHEQRLLNGSAPAACQTLESVCRKLGIHSRRVSDWRNGHLIRAGVVDQIALRAGVLWFDIYDSARFPDEHEAAAGAFA